MNDYMDERTNLMNQSKNERTNKLIELINWRMNELMNERTNWMNESKNEWINEWMNKWMDE